MVEGEEELSHSEGERQEGCYCEHCSRPPLEEVEGASGVRMVLFDPVLQ